MGVRARGRRRPPRAARQAGACPACGDYNELAGQRAGCSCLRPCWRPQGPQQRGLPGASAAWPARIASRRTSRGGNRCPVAAEEARQEQEAAAAGALGALLGPKMMPALERVSFSPTSGRMSENKDYLDKDCLFTAEGAAALLGGLREGG